jgi:hypothetical protein
MYNNINMKPLLKILTADLYHNTDYVKRNSKIDIKLFKMVTK